MLLLQVIENQRDDLVVILAGYKERMALLQCKSRLSLADRPPHSTSRITRLEELIAIALMVRQQMYTFDDDRGRRLANTWRCA